MVTALLFAAAIATLAFAWRGWLVSPVPAGPDAAQSLVERIDALLPQTQCGQCGHGGCRPYAQAIAAGEAAELVWLLEHPPLYTAGTSA
ncbi:MAG TPA: (Fe-S)-binding protein, partial [Chiayiivirga sp.]|nr:(Fe-S)-binding protein [Chiayiivirga sp.]